MAKEQKKKEKFTEGFAPTASYPMPEPLSYLNVKPSKRKPDTTQS